MKNQNNKVFIVSKQFQIPAIWFHITLKHRTLKYKQFFYQIK